MKEVDVVVLTWNQLFYIKRFVESFIENTTIPCNLIIVDNGSDDGTVDYLKTLKDTDLIHYEMIFNKENQGVAKGRNQGMLKGNAEYIAIVDNDVVLTPAWLTKLLATFKSSDKLGMLAAMSNTLELHVPKDSNLDDFALGLNDKYGTEFIEATFCPPYCSITSRNIAEKGGFFDEAYTPFWAEDTDYAMKVSQEGFLIAMAKGVYVFHDENKSPIHKSSAKQAIIDRSMAVYHGKWGRILRVAWILNIEELTKERLQEAIDVARMGNSVYLYIKGMKSKPSEIFSNFSLRQHTGVYLNPVSSYAKPIFNCIKKKKKFDVVVGKFRALTFASIFRGSTILRKFDKNKIMDIKNKTKIER